MGGSSSIGSFSILKVSGTLTSIGNKIDIGKNVGIGDFAHIGGAGGVVIGNDTIADAYLSLHPENHVFIDKQQLIREQGVTRKGIIIGSNCWIGAKVTVLDGSQVGNGCVIAAGAVVNGIFPDNVVIGGVPAKILKEI
ncbi:acyltransferase [Shewanella frigidimarina]|uniref:acyltransferase n=1 Tax=Shewanella frigidimarina TaxID=56812 RepID=UPI003D79D41D